MADATAAWAGMGETIIGGLVSAFGAFQGGEAQQKMYDYQAGIARFNAQIAYQNATYVSQVGEINATRAGLQGAQTLGRIKAAQSASGLDVNSGSAVDVRAAQQKATSFDLATIRMNAAKSAYNYQVQGVQFGAQAQLDTMAGQNARAAGMISAASSLVGAASSVSSEWMRGSQLGLWGSSTSGTTATNPSMAPIGTSDYGGAGVPLGQGGIGHQ